MTSSPEETAKVLRSFFADGRLTAMPRPGKKRQIALEHIVTRFEPGRRYTEPEINAVLRQVWPTDVAAVRRYLVDVQLLERANGEYWRIGGQLDPDDLDGR